MPSGVMAQNIALLIHSGTTRDEENDACCRSFICHHSSHLLLWEENSYSELINMKAVVIDTSNKTTSCDFRIPPMMLRDVESTLSKTSEPISSFLLELPHRELGGKLTPWDDVLSIGELCKRRGIRYHCDGARIFEAAAGYGMQLGEVAEPFDSIYISFYKGLGAISGAMLIGKKEFCDEARIWLRRFGGNLYTLLPYFVSSYMGYKRHVFGVVGETIGFDERLLKLKRLTRRISEETKFNSIASFDPVTPETNMIHVYLKIPFEDCIKARDKVIQHLGVSIFSRVKQIEDSERSYKGGYRAKFEWTIGEANGSISDDSFVQAWNHFCKEITKND
jgi:threonine aldolase